MKVHRGELRMKCQYCGKKISWIEGILGESACDDCAKEGQIQQNKQKGTKE